MRILSWTDVNSGALGRDPMPASATIGVFDGLHLGHQELIQRIVAKGPELVPTVFTFRDNPKRHTAVHKSSTALYSLTQKMEALEAKGVQTLVLIDFSSDFSKLLGEDFIAYLVRFCAVRSFVVGSDFKCGYRLSTDAHGLERIALKLGATAEVVTPLLYDGEPVSSSRIRHAIADGRMDL
ncbi:MAG TPA: FAD synthetase family protein, partial [Spirochaetales bacterium]|nr:FAD synthetase family protein [Spirochaetales bacterium]